MRLSISQKRRIIRLYKHNISFSKQKYNTLKKIAASEDIIVSVKAIKLIVRKWLLKRILCDVMPRSRAVSHTKISEYEMLYLDNCIKANRELTAKTSKDQLHSITSRTFKIEPCECR